MVSENQNQEEALEESLESQEEIEIDGGDVWDLSEDSSDFPQFVPPTHREKTARFIAILLIAILTLSVVFHYAMVIICSLCFENLDIQKLSQIYDGWLPVISGFVGAAVTYYYTQGGDR